MNFQEYYEQVVECLLQLDETRKPDKKEVMQDYENSVPAKSCARSFFNLWHSED